MTVRAPLLMVTVGPVSMIVAPWPLEIVMPVSLIMIIAPVELLSSSPPAGPGASLTEIVFWAVVCTRTCEIAGGTASASAGTSAALPHQLPVHTGCSGSPCSNSTQTPAPIGGTLHSPAWMPANGTHGSAHDDGTEPSTSGTIACNRPRC